ncbi:hypothetical protein PV327_000824 [Microctonus hyperodae]|uniref:HP domain-containing protein n=1 Tax=Microctonus hyperodae TaxID=165561 RepID=A0AA39G6Y8_MICHY|nr:hypothetical protein PV327_000824 [Microctonus hyperodae]
MVVAGGTAMMGASEGSSSNVTENITSQYQVQHGQQSTDSLVKRTTRSGSTDSIKKKESFKSSIQNKTASIRETKTSRLRAASIVSPVDASSIPRRIGFSDSVPSVVSQSSVNYSIKQKKHPMSSSNSLSHSQSTSSSSSSSSSSTSLSRDKDRQNNRRLSNKLPESDEKQSDTTNCDKNDRRSKRLTKSNFVINKTSNISDGSSSNCVNVNNSSLTDQHNHHRRYNDSKDNVRCINSQQSTSRIINIASSSRVSSTFVSSSGMKRCGGITQRSGNGHDSNNEVLQRVDALTALTRETMERVERLTSSASCSSSHALIPINNRSNVKDNSYCSSVPIVNKSRTNITKQLLKSTCAVTSLSSLPSSSSSSSSSPLSLSLSNNSNSILKTINNDDIVHHQLTSNRHQPLPISILKHNKSTDIEISDEISPRVLSTVVLDDDNCISKKHGILKKRSSLDESEILRRSYSPDVYAEINNVESRTILKNERRSSLDELVKRLRSPEPQHPTSILKRKSSGEDDREDIGSPEPQSILKRSSYCGGKSNLSGHHVNIAAAVAKTLGGMESFNDRFSGEVRPILKKKMSREESSSSDPPSLEPRPILKKKSSTESDEHEERPKKTILKSSKRSSEESSNDSENASPRRLSLLKNHALQRRTNSLPECDAVRPILKNSSSSRSRSSDITPRDLRKRARSVGHENTSNNDWIGMYDSSDDILNVHYRPSLNTSPLCCNTSASSITPIVSFKLPSREDEVVYCNSDVDIPPSDDSSCRRLNDGIAKLRRARYTSRRIRDRKELLSNDNSDIYQLLNDTAMIDNSKLSSSTTKTMVNSGMTKEQIHEIVDVNNGDADIDTPTLEGRRQYMTNRRNNTAQVSLRFKAMADQVNTNSAKDNNYQTQTAKCNSPFNDVSPSHRHDVVYDRFDTQPVTYQEIKAATLHNEAERVRLFNRRIATESVAKAGISLDRNQRRPHSRFKTQPVTSEEVEVASRCIPATMSVLKRTSTETLDVPSTISTSTTQQVHSESLKSILKSSSLHGISNRRQKSTEFIESRDSNENHKLIYSRKYKESSFNGGEIKMETCNYSEDHNDGVIFQNKTEQIRKTCSVTNKMNESTVPSSEYIDSNSLTSESALTTQKTMRQRNLLSANKSQCLSECKSIDENILDTDISRYVRPMLSAQSVDYPSISIADRLAALQRSGSNDWKRRVTSEPVPSIIIEKTNGNDCEKVMDICQREKEELAVKQRRLADRLEKLESAAEGWRKRVTVTDAIKFSVAGKMRVEQPDSFNINSKPLFDLMGGNCVSTDRKKKIPRGEQFKNESAIDNTSKMNINDHMTEIIRGNSSRTISDESDDELKNDQPYSIQYVPRADDETFSSFFESVSVDRCLEESIDVAESDFDVITPFSEMLGSRRTTKAPQRRNQSSRNPLRALAARTDLKNEYIDVTTGVAERVMKMTNVEKLAQNSSLAVEALAGLASTENFNAVTLKNITDNNIGYGNKLRPYKDVMLILVKGRRHVQVRLVEAIASNVNSGDNYILVTKTELYNYVGKYSNIIEKSRAAEIALRILQNKDLGCRALKIITIGNDIPTCTQTEIQNFWKLLGENNPLDLDIVEAGHPDEDELYESALIDTNVVYEVTNDRLIPLEKYWGAIPKIKMLDPSKILVFDFGSEMYIWNGKIAPTDKRKVATHLAQNLWNDGYDYSECSACPIDAASMIGRRLNIPVTIKKNNSRPEWCLLAKLTQHMETILFREKFLDWPNASGVIRVKQPEEKEQIDAKIIVEPPDVNLMIQPNDSKVDLILEGCHLGRGNGWFDEELSRQYSVITTDVTVWHIDEYSYTILDKKSIGQFFTGDSYIVRWMYTITVTGRELSGLPSKHAVEGRDRCAYFIWQGKNASLNKQGTAALLTVELDKEQGPQIRVVEGFEPSAFLNLFNGGMVIHSGKRSEEMNVKKPRAYICRGGQQSETSLIEVARSPKQLRSRGSMVFLDDKSKKFVVWHGRHSLTHVQNNAFHAANKMKDNCPLEAGLCANNKYIVDEVYEGKEPTEFFQGGMDRKLHLTLNRKKSVPHHTLRLFHFSSLSGEFAATEVLCPHRSDLITPFPFLQEELYQVNQPALFLLDNKDELWLWQGWWPDSGSDDQTGSGAVRWQAERRAAMTVALQYWKKLHPKAKKCSVYLIWAGLEPREFINLFPTWSDHDEVAELNIQDGRAPGEVLSVESELARLMQSTYPPAQLLQRPLPEGVDPTSLELYLSPQHFQELLGMNIEEFQDLPSWKQKDIKKKIGLF